MNQQRTAINRLYRKVMEKIDLHRRTLIAYDKERRLNFNVREINFQAPYGRPQITVSIRKGCIPELHKLALDQDCEIRVTAGDIEKSFEAFEFDIGEEFARHIALVKAQSIKSPNRTRIRRKR